MNKETLIKDQISQAQLVLFIILRSVDNRNMQRDIKIQNVGKYVFLHPKLLNTYY